MHHLFTIGAGAAAACLLAGVAMAQGAQDVPTDGELLADADEGGVFSGTGPDDCLLFAADALGASAVCRGAFGFNVIVHDSDSRIFLGLAHPDWAATAQIDPTPLAPGFSWLPLDVVEWRVAGGAPYALIVLLGVQGPDDDARSQTALVIRVAPDDPEQTCLVAAVPAGPEMEIEAREVAREAGAKDCV